MLSQTIIHYLCVSLAHPGWLESRGRSRSQPYLNQLHYGKMALEEAVPSLGRSAAHRSG